MSFFHVLPSNVAPDSFPRNHASAFSTPVTNYYHLEGKWEIALMNITYSSCINTFHQDQIMVDKSFELKGSLPTNNRAMRIKVTANSLLELVDSINDKLKRVVKITLRNGNRFCKWHVVMPGVIVIIPESFKLLFGLWHDVITHWDDNVDNYNKMQHKNLKGQEFYITVIPPSYAHKSSVTLKEENEKIESDEFVKRFDDKLGHVLNITENDKRFTVKKLHDDNILAVFSPPLLEKIHFRQAGFLKPGVERSLYPDFSSSFKEVWKVHLYHLKEVQDPPTKMKVPITLDSLSFRTQKAAVSYLNEKVDVANIVFTLSQDNILHLKILDEKTCVTFSDSLRDIFAFDQNSYTGKGLFSASGSFSLTRRIHYLYVYSSVSDYIRIGDTEAPLLAIIPFNHEVCSDLLQEKTFKTPMYVPVIQNPISQIDIAIYDGAGELVPFATDAVSSLRLHFRQL